MIGHTVKKKKIMRRKFTVQCNAIRWEQVLRRCRLGQLNKAYRDEHDFLEQIY